MSRHRPMMEALEGRRLLSSSSLITVPPVIIGPLTPPAANEPAQPATTPDGSTTPGTSPTPTSPATPATPTTRSTDLKGRWRGRIKGKLLFVSKKFDAELNIAEQTDRTLTGSIEIEGRDFSGTFNGRIGPKGGFVYTLKDDGASVKIVGQLNAAGTRMTGKITAKYSVLSVKGKFDFKNVGE